MEAKIDSRKYVSPNIEHESPSPTFMRDKFCLWLSDGHTRKYSVQVSAENIDRISEYVTKRRISVSIWRITKPSVFSTVFQKVLNAKLLRITDNRTYKIFAVVGQLYLRFLKEKPWKPVSVIPVESQVQVHTETDSKAAPSSLKSTISSSNNLLFRKDVDLSLLKYGFTIPQSAIVALCANLRTEIPRGGSYCISLVVEGTTYSASISNVGFADETRQQMQFRYTQASPIVNVLKGIFTQSYTFLVVGKRPENKEYIEVLSVSIDKFELLCYPSSSATTTLEEEITYQANTNDYKNCTALNENDQERVKHIITHRFRSGYRTSSSIDFERFKNYYVKDYGVDFESSSDDLDVLMESGAVLFDDRAYMFDEKTIEAVRLYLEQIDSTCIYLDAFFMKYSDEMYNHGIFSVDMFKAFIEKNYADVLCKRDYVYLRPDSSPTNMIQQVFNERETWSVEDLFVRLPWLKQDTIRTTLNSSNYHRIKAGVYTHIDNIDLPDSEGEKVLAFVRGRLLHCNYVIANELDLSRFESLNPHCPFSAIRDAVFNKFLSTNYCKSGQVITRIGEKLRVLDILEQYCREAETVSFEELTSFEATFDPEGRTHSTCLIAAHNVMVRVSADLFVAESKVSFDVERTDEVIALYCRNDFIPLKNVLDFSLFPYAGYPWNLFLLESFVRKYSHQFKYDVRAVNSSNIGVIVTSSFKYEEYNDILATALARSALSLNSQNAVGDYLFDNGYIGWRNLGKSESKILAAAKKLRDGGTV
jgi:hypothetical protein